MAPRPPGGGFSNYTQQRNSRGWHLFNYFVVIKFLKQLAGCVQAACLKGISLHAERQCC